MQRRQNCCTRPIATIYLPTATILPVAKAQFYYSKLSPAKAQAVVVSIADGDGLMKFRRQVLSGE